MDRETLLEYRAELRMLRRLKAQNDRRIEELEQIVATIIPRGNRG